MTGIGFDRRVLNLFDRGTLARGHDYQHRSHVIDLQIEGGGMQLLAAVSGKELQPYEVDITIVPHRHLGFDVQGYLRARRYSKNPQSSGAHPG